MQVKAQRQVNKALVRTIGPLSFELVEWEATILSNLRVALSDLLEARGHFELSILGKVGMLGREDLDGNVLGWLAVADAARPD
jgi:hypothetical protein